MYTMLLEEVQAEHYELDSLRKGWAVAPPSLMEEVHKHLGISEIVQMYGSSEAITITTALPSDPLNYRFESCGRPVPGMRVRIVEPGTDRELPPGAIGEINASGPLAMLGYFNDPEATSEVFDGPWLRTGDLGRLDENGYLFFEGRVKDMLKPGGENVSAAEIERFLLTHRDISQVAIVGIPDPRFGEVPAAVIQPKTGTLLAGDDILRHCEGQIARFKTPKEILFVSSLPMLETGKIDKVTVRQWVGARLEARSVLARGPSMKSGHSRAVG